MSTERHYGWMWLQALELVDEAERLQRRFLRYLGPGDAAVCWEPPVDIHETAEEVVVVFALPGVAPQDIEIRLEDAALTVSATRSLRRAHGGALIRRLEIPHGRFLRQIALPEAALKLAASHYLNGCLEVHLTRSASRT
jgi:HSP20 family protein